MLEKYRRIDIKEFLTDYRGNKHKLQELENEKRYLLGAAGIDISKEAVNSGKISSPTESTTIARERLDRRIAELTEYFRAFDAAMDYLGEPDSIIIRGYYTDNYSSEQAATLALESLGYSASTIRNRRDKAIRRLYHFFN